MSISRKLLQTQSSGYSGPIGGAYLASTDSGNISGIWTCPTGVTSVSVLCIGRGGEGRWSINGGAGGGGGALAWVNNLTVTPGASYSVVVSGNNNIGSAFYNSDETVTYCQALPGRRPPGGTAFVGGDGGLVGVGTGYSGGNGAARGDTLNRSGGGGGAAGYAGNGGAGGIGGNPGDAGSDAATGSGGGGGGGCAGTADTAGSGGGVGPYGLGAAGTGGASSIGDGNPGTGGSGGQDGTYPPGGIWVSTGGDYGGGGGGSDFTDDRELGIQSFGIVRIIWPGNLRQFPSTDVDLASSIDGETLIV
jgi:hypothetical protein